MNIDKTIAPENIVARKIEELSSTVDAELMNILPEFNGLSVRDAENIIKMIDAFTTNDTTRWLAEELANKLSTILKNKVIEVK